MHDADGLSVHLAGVGEKEGQLEDVVPRRSVGQHVHVAAHKQLTLAHHRTELERGGGGGGRRGGEDNKTN